MAVFSLVDLQIFFTSFAICYTFKDIKGKNIDCVELPKHALHLNMTCVWIWVYNLRVIFTLAEEQILSSSCRVSETNGKIKEAC